MQKRNKAIDSIMPADQALKQSVQAHLDDLTKPRGSLGRLEEIALQYCLATGTVKPVLGKKKIFCFACDHGVAAEGVSAYPKEVTPQMVMNMLSGGAAVNVLARHVGAELLVVDMGVDDPLAQARGLCRKKIRRGTGNIACGPAMTVDEAWQAIEIGIELAQAAQAEGVALIGTGEMGIANTTPSSALLAAFLGCPVADVTGRGTGIDDAGLGKKMAVIQKALAVNKHRLTDPVNTLAALGGFEIAAICGLILGAAAKQIPVVVDGFISSAGALAAIGMNKAVLDYLFFSHMSQEKGHRVFFKQFGLKPILDLDLRLGEGTGAALAFPVIEAALKLYNEMATFSSAHVSDKA
ncbi:MAG: nicotinate-nucleotide--dimethylbenzimidazole phosphoribosyltransferase [Kiritimatiellia bacterium]|jgi:nicotinate-nucleotide--dimethylbenzimidazole phosphoribosyltransferase